MKKFLSTLVASILVIGASAQTAITATWPFSDGANNSTAATISLDNIVSNSSFEFGNNYGYNTTELTRTLNGYTFSEIRPTNTISSTAGQNDYVKFRLKLKKGLKFTPTNISFRAAKVGTSGGTLNVKYYFEGGDTITLASAQNPNRNNVAPPYTEYSYDISNATESENALCLLIEVYNLNNSKALALNNIVLAGTYNGTIENVSSYTLNTSVNNTEAGSVTVSPSANKYDDGTKIKLTANENFSYHFQKWIDGNGNEISTENPFSFAITANTAIQAVYTKNDTYSFRLNYTNGACANQVDVEPIGTLINNTYYYEAGTQVKLTASDNPILTFTGWEDNSTSKERTITIDTDKDLTANYSATDYIVGWDFVQQSPKNDRTGDYAAETENSGMFYQKKSDGTENSWLSHTNYMGKDCAISWAPFTDNHYFQASFSTKEYHNIKILASLGCQYKAYSIQNWEYSLNDTTFTKFGTDNLTANSWTTSTFSLPTEAEDKNVVYVRWKADTESPIIGNESTVNGFAMTDVFVFGEKKEEADNTAPKLIASNPENLSTGSSANGSVILTFNEKIAAGTGNATLNGETLDMKISGNTAVFNYNSLDYNTKYTFSLPSGIITDRSGNAYDGTEIIFTTMERIQPIARLYDAVVAQDGSGNYTNIQAAIDAAPTNAVSPYLIFIKAGTYKGHIDIPSTKPYLHFIGQGYDKVFISDSLLCGGSNALSVDKGATVVARPENLYFEGISFVNSYGKDKNAGPQALALYTLSDRVILNKCGLYSYQDTWLTTTKVNARQYAHRCWIEGAVDFIYGQGNVVIDNSKINLVRNSGGYIVAPNHAANTTWGYVFLNDTITAPGKPSETSVWLGRPWHDYPKTVYINTVSEVTIPAAGWYNTMGGLPTLWADYNTMDAKSNKLDLKYRQNTYYYINGSDTVWGKAKNYLTDEEAAQYTVKNVLTGDDAWQPSLICEECAAPQTTNHNGILSWTKVPYAICYIIERKDSVIAFTTSTTYTTDGNAEYHIMAVNENGGLSEISINSVNTGINNTLENKNHTNVEKIYSIDGKQQDTVKHGINIIISKDSKGNKIIKKILKK